MQVRFLPGVPQTRSFASCSYTKKQKNVIIKHGNRQKTKVKTKMQTLISLILQSHSLSEIERQTLLETIKHLPLSRLDQLTRIFTIEKEGLEAIEKEFIAQSNSTNQKHIQQVNNLMKDEKRKAVASEEKDESKNGDQILNQLNNT